LLAAAACASAPPRNLVTVVVSANAEWKAVRTELAETPQPSPYGEWLVHRLAGQDVLFFHGGYGKVAAAGSTQYVIDRFRPRLLVNLGTCGGFAGGVRVGDVLLVGETIIYDIVEQMGDADEAIADYSTRLEPGLWPAALRARVRVERMVSGDRDLIPAELPRLEARFHAVAGDWESGAIAWVAHRNRTPLVILRGVTDLVGAGGDITYGNPGAFEVAARSVMHTLLALLAEALPQLTS
jgi:adenosylhomocysteine nucleosidase